MKFLIFLFFVSLQICFSQQEFNYWYFPRLVGIDFNSGLPIVLTDGKISSVDAEACASIADANGNLLFSTDGVDVWDRNMNEMPSTIPGGADLKGHYSTAQGALIVPNPGNADHYYVFTLDNQAGANGLRYSEIDMNLNGTMGDVIAATKNTVLFGPATERLNATQHCNGVDFWVLAHDLNNNRFLKFLITATGITFTTQDIGVVYENTLFPTGLGFMISQMKFSPNGRMLATNIRDAGVSSAVDLFCFDNCTGKLSNFNQYFLPTNGTSYGIEFSGDNSKLYSSVWMPPVTNIFQFDLNAADIQGSRQIIGSTDISASALQLAPDGKIYATERFNSFLAIINNPNIAGLGSNFVLDGLFLNGRDISIGLPNVIMNIGQSYQLLLNDSISICAGDDTTITAQNGVSYFWTSDPMDMSLIGQNDQPSILVSPTTTTHYIVQVTELLGCKYRDTVIVDVQNCGCMPVISSITNVQPTECSSCTGQATANVSGGAGPYTYTWSTIPLQTTQTATGLCAGTYFVTITGNDGCDTVLTTNIMTNPTSASTVDTAICDGQSYTAGGSAQTMPGTYYDTLMAGNSCDSIVTTNLSILSNTGSTNDRSICQGDSLYIDGAWQTTAGIYYDTLVNSNGCDSVVTTNLSILASTGSTNNQSICQGDSLFLAGGWQTTAGTYSDTLVNSNGCDSVVSTNLSVDSFLFSTHTAFICDGDTISIYGLPRTSAGTYSDTSTSVQGCDSISSTVLTVLPPYSSLSTVTICNGETFWFNGIPLSNQGTYYDTLTAANGCDSTITVTLTVNQVTSDSSNITICDGETVLIHGNMQSTAGTYRDTLTNVNGCDSISIISLTVNQLIYATKDTVICDGESIFLGGQSQTMAGTYYDTLTATAGCDTVLATILTINPAPVANFTINPNPGLAFDTIRFSDASTGSLVQWCWSIWTPSEVIGDTTVYCPGELNEQHVFAQEGLYTVFLQITDLNGCSAASQQQMEITEMTTVYFPNAFTPNGDGINETFFPVITGIQLDNCNFYIFNRWGEIIFSPADCSGGWDGTYQGQQAPVDIYTWRINFSDINHHRAYTYIGHVALLK